MNEIIIIISSFILSLLLVYGTMRMTISFGFHDVPDGRKVHKENIPTMAGLAIFISLWLTIFILDIFRIFPIHDIIFRVFAVSIALFVLGIVDDVKGVSAKLKFMIQIIAGTLFFIWNNNNSVILFVNPAVSGIIFAFLSAFWFALLVNGINFIDGLDGLGAGVSIILSIAVYVIAYLSGIHYLSYINLALIGSLAGFIIFNFYPAKIFMGDTGSLFIGGIFSMSSILLVYHSLDRWFTFVILFTYPIIDVLLSILRRFIRKQNIFAPDNRHIHHIVKGEDVNQKKAVITIYALNVIYAIMAVAYFISFNAAIPILYGIYTAFLIIYFLYRMLKSK